MCCDEQKDGMISARRHESLARRAQHAKRDARAHLISTAMAATRAHLVSLQDGQEMHGRCACKSAEGLVDCLRLVCILAEDSQTRASPGSFSK